MSWRGPAPTSRVSLCFPAPLPCLPAGGGELRLVLHLHLGLPKRIPESAPGHHGECGALRVGRQPGLKWHRLQDGSLESQRIFLRLTQGLKGVREGSQNNLVGSDL